ncbi:hypothetical protein ACIQU6_43730 [Streptomyces sp. NPDC090442]|uniref:hypothetical protein n=1 Tax=Streptomyces sp. NPDC090442 TaxID=3365962 RepID=UPI003819668D
MKDTLLPAVRVAVCQAADRLDTDAVALTAGSAQALDVGLNTRVQDLRQAAVAAWRAGVPAALIARDARLDLATISGWIDLEKQEGGEPKTPAR